MEWGWSGGAQRRGALGRIGIGLVNADISFYDLGTQIWASRSRGFGLSGVLPRIGLFCSQQLRFSVPFSADFLTI